MKTKMNVKLLCEIKREILKRPTQFNMDWWFQDTSAIGKAAGGCGIAACIGGWAIAIARTPNRKRVRLDEAHEASSGSPSSDQIRARMLLGLTQEQSNRLFNKHLWPVRYRLNRAKSINGMVRRAVARINMFIKTKGRV